MKKKTHKKIASTGEFPLIQQLTRTLSNDTSVIKGVGDDCAVIKLSWKSYELFATDMLIEDVHFKRKSMTPQQIGYKAMARNISDIAAMGGEPTHAVVAVALPSSLPVKYVSALYSGIKRSARAFDVNIVGGDTAKHSKIVITISIVGEVEKANLVLRSGAKEGDCVYVTGSLGGSITKKHYSFKPRVDEARALGRFCKVHAMIDVSDGLVQDLNHILSASKVGCVLRQEALPVSKDAYALVRQHKDRALKRALYDGEDFELLFTVSKKSSSLLEKKWKKQMRTPLTKIGTITKGKKLYVEDEHGRRKELSNKGYTHF